jgi:hypothetical protein
MSKWITDRLPTEEDSDSGGCVWSMYNGEVVLQWSHVIDEGTPWMPMIKPEPYLAPEPKYRVTREKRYDAELGVFDYAVSFGVGTIARHIPTREAAERIAAIYNEVMP